VFASVALLACVSCARSSAQTETGAPPAAIVEDEGTASVVRVDHPERFPVVAATPHRATPELSTTGVVSADVSRAIPVVSLASGRVIDVRVRLGDTVQKGQLLLRIQSADVTSAFADYRKAVADEVLARTQFERAQLLFDRGAIARKDLEVAQDTHDKAAVDVQTAIERLRILGVSIESQPDGIVDITAPASGVITEQNIAPAAGVKSLDNSPNLFTISDLSRVWILCDVYESDLARVHVGDRADIRLAALPNEVLAGQVGNIGPILDPAIRTGKVRIEVANPGGLRLGMFVTAALHGQSADERAAVPGTAVLHLHDRDWVYTPTADGRFARREVVAGAALADGQQEIVSGLKAGERVVSHALVLQNTVEQ
jgi:cobalt-zinc-cadmium efflux system membrane fusion protein